MKYPCKLIQDLIPLYIDNVCSDESKIIIESHLSQCDQCKKYYDSINSSEDFTISYENSNNELKKADSFKKLKRKFRKKQLIAIFIILIMLTISSLSVITFMKHSSHIINYDENISVSMIDNNITGRLQGNQANYFKVKRVENNENTYLFFYMTGTKWDELITSENVFSEYVLCPADKGAESIDKVFYYTGDYTNIENMSENELKKIIDNSQLLWEKTGKI